VHKKLKAIIEERPELKEKTIQEGDAFAAACEENDEDITNMVVVMRTSLTWI
jgi:hypothetical protein